MIISPPRQGAQPRGTPWARRGDRPVAEHTAADQAGGDGGWVAAGLSLYRGRGHDNDIHEESS